MTDNHLLLYRLAELMLEHEQHILPVDLLFDDEQIGDFVKGIQIDSPYQQMLFEGVLTESIRDEMLYVSFTIEGYFHYVLGEVLNNHFYREGDEGLRYIVNLIEQSSFSQIEQAASQFFVNQVNNGALTFIHSVIEYDFDRKGLLTPAIVQLLLLNCNDNYIFKIDDKKLWGEVLQKLLQISKYELASKCIASLDKNISKNLLSSDVIPHLNNELLQSLYKKLGQADSNFALEFYLGHYENLTTQFIKRENQLLIPEVDLLYVASAFIDTGKYENAIAVLNGNNFSENSFIERYRLHSIALNGLSLNREAVESISIAIQKADEQYGQYHFKTAELINLKGLYSLVQSEFQEAIDCFNKCAKIYQNVKGEDNFEFATAVNNMALVLYHKDDFQSAIENWEQAIAILSSLGMQSHPETANIHKSLALCHEKTGHVKNARYNIDKALTILNENNLGDSEAGLEYKQIFNRIFSNDL